MIFEISKETLIFKDPENDDGPFEAIEIKKGDDQVVLIPLDEVCEAEARDIARIIFDELNRIYMEGAELAEVENEIAR